MAGRLEGDPGVAGRRAGDGRRRRPDRPVARLQREVAASGSPGSPSSAGEAVETRPRRPQATRRSPRSCPRLRAAAADAAREALDGDRASTSPRGRCPSAGGAELGADAVRGQAAPHAARPGRSRRPRSSPRPSASSRPSAREMVRIAREIWPAWRGDDERPTTRGAGPGRPGRDRRRPPGSATSCSYCREELVRVEAFCREREVIGLVDEPLEIDWTPRVHALVRRRDAGSRRAAGPRPEDVLLDHPGPRGVAARAAPSRTCARTTAGCPAAHDPRGGSRALPPERLREPGLVAGAARVPPGCSPRAGRST